MQKAHTCNFGGQSLRCFARLCARQLSSGAHHKPAQSAAVSTGPLLLPLTKLTKLTKLAKLAKLAPTRQIAASPKLEHQTGRQTAPKLGPSTGRPLAT